MHDKCEVCGKPIEQPKRGRRRKYDSAACRAKAYRQRKVIREGKKRDRRLVCAWCGVKFERRSEQGPAPRFHSNACRQAAQRQRDRLREGILAEMPVRKTEDLALFKWACRQIDAGHPVPTCPTCGKPVRDEKPTGRPKVYCRDECRKEAYRQRLTACPVCGRYFDRTDARGHLSKVYCSERCAALMRQWRKRAREALVVHLPIFEEEDDGLERWGYADDEDWDDYRDEDDDYGFSESRPLVWASDEELLEAEQAASEPPRRREVIDLGSDYGWFDI